MNCIKILTDTDVDGIYNIEKNCFSSPWSRETIERCINLTEYIFAGIYMGDELVAYGGIIIMPGEASITNVAVLESSRHMGFGRAVLDFIVLIAAERGAKSIFLEVRKSNLSAQALYTKRGFENNGVRRNFYRNPAEDAIIMIKTLMKEDLK